METPPVTVEQRHRDAAAAFFERRAENMVLTADLDIRFRNLADWIRAGHKDTLPEVQAFARFDTERNATLERENAALLEQLEFAVKLLSGFPGMGASAQIGSMRDTIARAKGYVTLDEYAARTTLGGQP